MCQFLYNNTIIINSTSFSLLENRQVLLWPPFYRWENWRLRRLPNFTKVNRARTQIRAAEPQSICWQPLSCCFSLKKETLHLELKKKVMSKVIILDVFSFLTFYNSIEYKPIILHCQIQRNLCLNILPVIFAIAEKNIGEKWHRFRWLEAETAGECSINSNGRAHNDSPFGNFTESGWISLPLRSFTGDKWTLKVESLFKIKKNSSKYVQVIGFKYCFPLFLNH